MQNFRQKRIDLSVYDDRWDKDTHIIVAPRGFMQIQETTRAFRKAQLEVEKSEFVVKKARAKLETASDDKIDDVFADIEKAEEQSENASNELLKLTVKIVKEAFISGKMLDPDTNECRELIAKDIENFDPEIMTAIARSVMGGVSKKD